MERLLTVAQRARRRQGQLVALSAIVVVTALGVMATRASKVDVPSFGSLVVGLVAAAVWGVRRGLEARHYIEVDPVDRIWVATENGTRGAEQPMQSIAPLRVCTSLASTFGIADGPHGAGVTNPRSVSLRGRGRYFVHPNDRPDLSFFGFRTAAQANTTLEALARRWDVASQRYGGAVRTATQTSVPLYQRLAGDANAARVLVANATWGFTVRPLSPGYRFTFTHPSKGAWLSPLLALAMAVVILAAMLRLGVIGEALDAEATLGSRLILGAFALMLLVMLLNALVGILHAWPGTLLITPKGVFIGRSHMTFAEIEDVSCVAGVQFQADHRTMTLPASWFPPAAGPMLSHEITRAILATAPYAEHSQTPISNGPHTSRISSTRGGGDAPTTAPPRQPR